MEHIDIQILDIKDQINNYYRQYAIYVIESRGIPNFYDSITPVQRLLLLNAPEKYSGTTALIGGVMGTGLYHHGDQSLAKAINKLAKPFACSERLLHGDGFFGSPITPKASSPRYTKIKISADTKQRINEYMSLNEKNHEGGYDWIHIDTPIGLATHIVGIAVGYRSNILPRKLSDVIEYLDGKPKQLKPYFDGFKGTIKKHQGVDKNGWLMEGLFTANDSDMLIEVKDIPPLISYDNFIKRVYEKLELYGGHYKMDNNSQSLVDLTIKWREKSSWPELKKEIEKLTKIIVIEGLVFVKDGCVLEYDEISDYLDDFRLHRERVIYKKMVYDLNVYNAELEFLKAKKEFLIFMMVQKRKNEEIKDFVSKYNRNIQIRLDAIKLTALSPETIKATEEAIKEMERNIKEQEKSCQIQLKKCKQLEHKFVSKGKINMSKSNALFEEEVPLAIDGVEIYTEEEEESDVENDSEIEDAD